MNIAQQLMPLEVQRELSGTCVCAGVALVQLFIVRAIGSNEVGGWTRRVFLVAVTPRRCALLTWSGGEWVAGSQTVKASGIRIRGAIVGIVITLERGWKKSSLFLDQGQTLEYLVFYIFLYLPQINFLSNMPWVGEVGGGELRGGIELRICSLTHQLTQYGRQTLPINNFPALGSYYRPKSPGSVHAWLEISHGKGRML